jgi:DNA repair protein RadC
MASCAKIRSCSFAALTADDLNPDEQEEVLRLARGVLESRILRSDVLQSPSETKAYLQYQLAGLEHEVFACVFLNNRHRIVAYEPLFRGTIDGASVHPREVIKVALRYNAAAVIFAHNHPSGEVEPSQADRSLTRRLQDACGLVDIRVLDHLVVSQEGIVSFAERGFL